MKLEKKQQTIHKHIKLPIELNSEVDRKIDLAKKKYKINFNLLIRELLADWVRGQQ